MNKEVIKESLGTWCINIKNLQHELTAIHRKFLTPYNRISDSKAICKLEKDRILKSIKNSTHINKVWQQICNNREGVQYLVKNKGNGEKKPRAKAGKYNQLFSKRPKVTRPGKLRSWLMVPSYPWFYVFRN